jgi:hypothetical protein
MINIDYSKINPTPTDKFEAIDFMLNSQRELLEAIHILHSIYIWDQEIDEYHLKRIKAFLLKYSI